MQIGKNPNSVIRAFRDPDDHTVHVFVGPLCVEWWRGLRHRPTVRWDHRGDWKAAA